jgi:hypothetical protein
VVYANRDQWAVRHDYADWAAYAAARPNVPTQAHIDEMLEEATEIINELLGTYNADTTTARFLSYLQKLTLRMVDRMRQIDKGQGTRANFPMFSPNDFLIERERQKVSEMAIQDETRALMGFGDGDD